MLVCLFPQNLRILAILQARPKHLELLCQEIVSTLSNKNAFKRSLFYAFSSRFGIPKRLCVADRKVFKSELLWRISGAERKTCLNSTKYAARMAVCNFRSILLRLCGLIRRWLRRQQQHFSFFEDVQLLVGFLQRLILGWRKIFLWP